MLTSRFSAHLDVHLLAHILSVPISRFVIGPGQSFERTFLGSRDKNGEINGRSTAPMVPQGGTPSRQRAGPDSSGPSHPTFGLSTVEGLHKALAVCGHNRMSVAGQCWIAGVNEVLDQIRRYRNPFVCSFPGFPDARWKCDFEDCAACSGFCGAWPT